MPDPTTARPPHASPAPSRLQAGRDAWREAVPSGDAVTMRALTADRYGGVEVLRLRQIAVPAPGPTDVLVRVQAAAANPADLHLLAGQPFLLRFMGNGLFRPRRAVPGSDVAGRVEAVGRDVTRFRPGDAVFADLADVGRGAFAELVAAPAHAWAGVPDGVDIEAAAAAPMAAVTALQGLRDEGGIEAGRHVLINGASGGVGSFAVQIAKALGADVTGVTSTRNVELVRSLGADHVIDYRQEDFAAGGARYDLIFDTVANRAVDDYRRALTPDGAFVTTGFLPALAMPRLGAARRPRMRNMLAKTRTADLETVAGWMASGQVVPRIDRTYALAEAADALRYLAEGRARGKVVLVP